MAEKNENIPVNVEPAQNADEDAYAPMVDIYEDTDGTTVLVAEIPAATDDSIDIRVDQGVLTLSADGHRPAPGKEYTKTYTGFVTGGYFRAFAISDEVDRERIEANYSNGLLTIRLPRAAAAQTRKIPIRED